MLLDKSTNTLIVGRNGEGKSTILDALTFALFGKPFRNINKNQLINSINGKAALVVVEFTASAKKYTVKRGIKPNIFEIWCDGVLMNQDAAAKDYQKALEQQILRLNYKTFTQVVILGSASFVPFMQLSSHQRRDVIEDILDIKIFSTMNQVLKEKVAETKTAIASLEVEISAAKSKVNSQSVLIKTLTAAKNDAIGSLQSKIEENLSQIESNERAAAELLSHIESLRERVADKHELERDYQQARDIKSKTASKVDHLTAQTSFFDSTDVCPSCTQGIPHTHKEQIVSELADKIASETARMEKLESHMAALNAKLAEKQAVLSEMTDKNIELSTHNSAITILNRQTAALQAEVDDSKANTSDVDAERRKLKQLATDAMAHITEKTELSKRRVVEDMANLLLKDTGIKTAIIREYLPIMNKLINKYLAAMDAYIHFELDESFNEIVKSRYRDDFTYDSFSEGEKQKIDLAILFTWRQIAKMKNSVNTNLLLMDEIFDSSLDAQGTDMLMNLLSQLTADTNVFVISHKGDQLFDKFRSVIKFVKINEFSVIAPPTS